MDVDEQHDENEPIKPALITAPVCIPWPEKITDMLVIPDMPGWILEDPLGSDQFVYVKELDASLHELATSLRRSKTARLDFSEPPSAASSSSSSPAASTELHFPNGPPSAAVSAAVSTSPLTPITLGYRFGQTRHKMGPDVRVQQTGHHPWEQYPFVTRHVAHFATPQKVLLLPEVSKRMNAIAQGATVNDAVLLNFLRERLRAAKARARLTADITLTQRISGQRLREFIDERSSTRGMVVALDTFFKEYVLEHAMERMHPYTVLFSRALMSVFDGAFAEVKLLNEQITENLICAWCKHYYGTDHPSKKVWVGVKNVPLAYFHLRGENLYLPVSHFERGDFYSDEPFANEVLKNRNDGAGDPEAEPNPLGHNGMVYNTKVFEIEPGHTVADRDGASVTNLDPTQIQGSTHLLVTYRYAQYPNMANGFPRFKDYVFCIHHYHEHNDCIVDGRQQLVRMKPYNLNKGFKMDGVAYEKDKC